VGKGQFNKYCRINFIGGGLWTCGPQVLLVDAITPCGAFIVLVGQQKASDTILTAIFPGEPGLPGCPLNSPPFIPGLRILLGQT